MVGLAWTPPGKFLNRVSHVRIVPGAPTGLYHLGRANQDGDSRLGHGRGYH